MRYSRKIETIKYLTLETPFAQDEYGKDLFKIMIDNISIIKTHKIVISPKLAVVDVNKMLSDYKKESSKLKLKLVKGQKNQLWLP